MGKVLGFQSENMQKGRRITIPKNTSFLRINTLNESTTLRVPYLLN
jgi:hypothetical protein